MGDRDQAGVHLLGQGREVAAGGHLGAYLDMPLDQALTSPHPIVQAFAFLDRKVGKRRLKNIDCEALHDFPQITYRLRCEREGVPVEAA